MQAKPSSKTGILTRFFKFWHRHWDLPRCIDAWVFREVFKREKCFYEKYTSKGKIR